MTSVRMRAIGATLCVLLQIASAASTYDGIPDYSLTENRAKRSSGTGCKNEIVGKLAKIANETCSQVETVDKYINDVKLKRSMPEPNFSDTHGFKAILIQYNRDLGVAKSNSHHWRNGDNIVDSIKAVLLSAKRFEPKFKQELAKSKAKIETLKENHEDIREVEAKIARLRNEIDEAREAVKQATSTTVKAHLEAGIREKEEEINKTMEEHQVVQGRRELTELVKYLEIVKDGAVAIQVESITVSAKLANFSKNISEDAGAFQRHQRNAQEGSAKLEEEKRKNDEEIESNKKSITDLRQKITEENNQISSLNAQIARAQQQIREIQERIERNLNRERKKKRFGSWFRFVPVVGWTIGNKYYKDAKRREEELKNEKQASITNSNQQIQNIRNHIATREADINRHQSRITALEAKSKELNMELQHFKQLNRNLQNLERDVSGILPSIESAVNSVGKIKATFDSVEQDLASIIQRAKEAKTAAEVRDIAYFVYNEIGKMECKWENASVKIVLVGRCTTKVDPSVFAVDNSYAVVAPWTPEIWPPRDLVNPRDIWPPREVVDPKEFMIPREVVDPREFMGPREFGHLREWNHGRL